VEEVRPPAAAQCQGSTHKPPLPAAAQRQGFLDDLPAHAALPRFALRFDPAYWEMTSASWQPSEPGMYKV